MKKSDDSPAISLFSFQDIITSITGIMFLVVLLLILLIFESKPVEKQEQKTEAAPELAAQIAALEKEIVEVRQRDELLKKRMDELQGMSADKIIRKKKELERELKEQKEKIKQQVQQKQQAEKTAEELIAQLENLKKHQRQSRDDLKDARAEAEKTKRQEEQLEQQLAEAKKTIRFTVEQQSSRTFLLIELDAGGFRIFDMKSKQTYDLRKSGTTLATQINTLKNWLGKRDSSSEAVSIILKPMYLKHWEDIQEMLARLRFKYGLEIYPNNEVSIFAGEKK